MSEETKSTIENTELGKAPHVVRELDENGSYVRHHLSTVDYETDLKNRRIRSFVIREGRLTPGQEHALGNYWPLYGIDYQDTFISPEKIFGRKAPLVVEIGFGMGKSLVEMAKNAPEMDFIGIEVHTPGIGACLMGINEERITNLRVIHYDAVDVLTNMIPNESVARLQLYFPDPWHKAKHNKRRLVKQDFMDLIMPKLIKGGIIHMATDWEAYAEQMLEVQSQDNRIENLSPDGTYVERPDFRPLTKFESRGQRLGHGVWDLMFRKK